ncbi:unnamed protein product [Choristocarpus tenellus]
MPVYLRCVMLHAASCFLPLLQTPLPLTFPRFDTIDTANLSHTLGAVNLVVAAAPLLKPTPHALLRTDVTRMRPKEGIAHLTPLGVDCEEFLSLGRYHCALLLGELF